MNPNYIGKNREVILSAIEQIIYEGGKSNFVIFNLNSDYYIQMAARRGDYEIYCEAISDNYLEEGKLLTQAQKETLKKLSWNDPENSEGNYFIKHNVDSELSRTNLSGLISKTANQVYSCEEIRAGNVILNLE